MPKQSAPLSVNQVVDKLQQKNAQRAAALAEFNSTRIYRIQYNSLFGSHDAEMVVKATYRAPDSKTFTVISQSGSRFVIDHVLKRLMESEQEYLNENNRQATEMDANNYKFRLAGYETTKDGAQYVLDLEPRSGNKFLYRGKIWVDAKDFAVVRMDGEPAKNPSLWIRKTEIHHRYIKVDDFWLPAENHTESLTRMGGRAVLSIEYKDYQITKASPIVALETAP